MMMKTLIAALIGVVAADLVSNIQQVPSCAFNCYWAVTSHLECGVSNFACACGDQGKLLGLLEPCTKLYCSEADYVLALSLTVDVCKDVENNPSMEQYYSASGAITAAVGQAGNSGPFSYSVTSGPPTTIAATTLTYSNTTTSISSLIINQTVEDSTTTTTTSESSSSTESTESTSFTGSRESTKSTSTSPTNTGKTVDATDTTENREKNDGASFHPGVGVIGGAVLAVLVM
ncbi:hypothetical protein F5Y18DRAFT_80329 [Xylariaceae sp. FL1019]|nr:hypothetical protein F5Y18DRAFT_80329 [Xylariaceae sp. FL1019]